MINVTTGITMFMKVPIVTPTKAWKAVSSENSKLPREPTTAIRYMNADEPESSSRPTARRKRSVCLSVTRLIAMNAVIVDLPGIGKHFREIRPRERIETDVRRVAWPTWR